MGSPPKHFDRPRVAVIGLGYVGLPLALAFSKSGNVDTVGIDIDLNKIDLLRSGKSYFRHIPDTCISESIATNTFSPYSSFEIVSDCQVIIICVPTPLGKHQEPDTSYISQTIDSIAPHLSSHTLVCLESTTYPGTSETLIRRRLEALTPYRCGVDLFVVYSPEREDPGNSASNVSKVPKVLAGITDTCLKKGVSIYSYICDQLVPVSSTSTAEAVKLTENIFRCINIALVNELKVLYDIMNIDIHEVIQAASSKPYGYMAFYPGPGLGGHCIPIDPYYLSWKAREYGVNCRFIELAGEINRSMPSYVVNKAIEVLNRKHLSLSASKILILGLAYKKNIDDDRESPSYSILKSLRMLGATVSYHDPFIKQIPLTREHKDLAGERSVEFSNEYDLYVLATDHDIFKTYSFDDLVGSILDTRGMFVGSSIPHFKA